MTAFPTRTAAVALYAPPFRYEHGYIFDANGHMVADDCGEQPGVATRVRGWGRIGYMKDAEALQDEVGALIAEILTAHWGSAGCSVSNRQTPGAPVHSAIEKLQWIVNCSDSEMRDGDAARELAAEIVQELKASPQTAPVELPEPAATVSATDGGTRWGSRGALRTDAAPARLGPINLYTEQQVRELLAAHGIGAPS